MDELTVKNYNFKERLNKLSKKDCVRFAVFCAESVSDKLDDETRDSSLNAITAAKLWVDGLLDIPSVKDAADAAAAAAAYAADSAAAAAAAGYAADAAGYAAYAADSAAAAAGGGALNQKQHLYLLNLEGLPSKFNYLFEDEQLTV